MKSKIILLALGLILMTGCRVRKQELPQTLSPISKCLKRTFIEDFDGNKLDSTAWGRYDREKSAPWSVYICDSIPELVEVSDGSLKVRAVWDKEKKHPWTGCVQTRHKKTIKYGRVDVRARFNRAGNGAWPAIWMLSQTPMFGKWPSSGEIDIMERINTEKQVHQVFHQSDSVYFERDIRKK